MIKRIVPIALIGASIFSLNACKSGGSFKKTENGVQYKIVKDEKGPDIFINYFGNSWCMVFHRPTRPVSPDNFVGQLQEKHRNEID